MSSSKDSTHPTSPLDDTHADLSGKEESGIEKGVDCVDSPKCDKPCKKSCKKTCEKPCKKPCDDPCKKPCKKSCDDPCKKPCKKPCDDPCKKTCVNPCKKTCSLFCKKPCVRTYLPCVTSAMKWWLAVLLGILYFIVAFGGTYNFTNALWTGLCLPSYINTSGCPKSFGVFVHAIVFILIIRLILW